jgi:uncharacterized protein (TIGR02391 family)
MNPTLQIPREEFQSKLSTRILAGKRIINDFMHSLTTSFEETERAFRQWDNYNKDWLSSCFVGSPNRITEDYNSTPNSTFDRMLAISNHEDTRSLAFKRSLFIGDIQPKIDYFEDLLARIEFIPYTGPAGPPPPLDSPSPIAHLHPAVQQATKSRFASGHHSDAISAACTALDKAVQANAQRPDLNGKQLMDVAFTPKNPVLRLSPNDNEQTGFMLLYQGVMQAIRNHYAHNLTEIPAARALEWLGFISALFYKLDEGMVTSNMPSV